MNSRLEDLFNSLERQRKILLEELIGISDEKLNDHATRKWSISQIANHIVTSERLSIGYISKKINAINEVGNTGLWGKILLLIFIISQRLPFKYKAPKLLLEQQTSYASLTSLEQDWDRVREELYILLTKFPDDGLKKKIYRHPVLGRSNIIQALVFFREHIIHHYPQIKRQL